MNVEQTGSVNYFESICFLYEKKKQKYFKYIKIYSFPHITKQTHIHGILSTVAFNYRLYNTSTITIWL